MAPYGDIRDTLAALPHFDPALHGYAVMDLFTTRWQLIRDLDPQPLSVFEFGALVGYFLVTAADAAPTIHDVGWIDNEAHTAGSNKLCREDMEHYARGHGRDFWLWHDTAQTRSADFGHADIVAVDAGHSYTDCFTDLEWARALTPRVIFVDDYKAIEPVRDATDAFARANGLEVEYHDTVNGLAVLRF